jgi:hypothetical protein
MEFDANAVLNGEEVKKGKLDVTWWGFIKRSILYSERP